MLKNGSNLEFCKKKRTTKLLEMLDSHMLETLEN